jgi:hypothetical protein
MVNRIGVFGSSSLLEQENPPFFNDITAHEPYVRSATFVDFVLTNWHIGVLDWVKGATNDNSSFDVEQS